MCIQKAQNILFYFSQKHQCDELKSTTLRVNLKIIYIGDLKAQPISGCSIFTENVPSLQKMHLNPKIDNKKTRMSMRCVLICTSYLKHTRKNVLNLDHLMLWVYPICVSYACSACWNLAFFLQILPHVVMLYLTAFKKRELFCTANDSVGCFQQNKHFAKILDSAKLYTQVERLQKCNQRS